MADHVIVLKNAVYNHDMAKCRQIIRAAKVAGIPFSPSVYDCLLRWAADTGNEYLCHLALDNGATDVDGMMAIAAEHTFIHICIIAKDHGANLAPMFNQENPELYKIACMWQQEKQMTSLKKKKKQEDRYAAAKTRYPVKKSNSNNHPLTIPH